MVLLEEDEIFNRRALLIVMRFQILFFCEIAKIDWFNTQSITILMFQIEEAMKGDLQIALPKKPQPGFHTLSQPSTSLIALV